MLNERVICIKSGLHKTTTGKIYNVVNGCIVWDDGNYDNNILSVENMNERFFSKFKLFTPKDLLMVGRVVELRNGTMGFVLPDRIVSKDGWYDINDYDVDCKDKNYPNLNIVEIYDCPILGNRAWNFGAENKKSLVSVWKREEKSPQQIEKEAIRSEMEKLAKRLEELEVK